MRHLALESGVLFWHELGWRRLAAAWAGEQQRIRALLRQYAASAFNNSSFGEMDCLPLAAALAHEQQRVHIPLRQCVHAAIMVPSSPCIAILLHMMYERQQSGHHGSSPAARLLGQGSSAPGRPRIPPHTWPVLVSAPGAACGRSPVLSFGSSSDHSRRASCRATIVSR